MQLPIYQVDAFTDRVLGGNPAAVCPLESWLDDVTLQRIAEENNLSETAYFVREGEGYRLRWFTPAVEVDLCGHATLAAAWVLFNELGETAETLRFFTRSGELRVSRNGALLAMDFPLGNPQPLEVPPALAAALGCDIESLHYADDFFVIVRDAQVIDLLTPDIAALAQFDVRGICVSAPGVEHDIVSRWFGPRVGVNEDPVTGSAHTSLARYWSQRLGKNLLNARQGGARQGQLRCEVRDNGRVIISGQAALYLRGTLYL
ncbi:PhzF family phenazine biosynthesis protein [Pseudomonas fontis]|uniref:PhzF family phenazine biosynthesis protein n=1 Tax=Pseudomonas fontis TaxID=2942633 RepID=A0ABT5NWM0_9PSED|nr:PhzF family phenazine biosynthesis protein [Pseudomonas fontis]MDD0976217.1 PhzF family phenazine biosynthesis protein [Pseudomonas fontis]MDD0992493.1 PhzF family phenazine biosynthesis protein [Pseudomonas fontis]